MAYQWQFVSAAVSGAAAAAIAAGLTLTACHGAKVSAHDTETDDDGNSPPPVVVDLCGPVVVDGLANEPTWDRTGIAIAKVIEGTWDAPDAAFQLRWSAEYLGFLVVVQDVLPWSDAADPRDDDAIEVFLDMQHDGEPAYGVDDFHFVVPRGAGEPWERSGRTAGVLARAVATLEGYSLELLVPWTTLGISPEIGAAFGVDVVVDFDQDGSARDARRAWSGTGRNHTSTEDFGAAELLASCRLAASPAHAPPDVIVSQGNSGTLVEWVATGQVTAFDESWQALREAFGSVPSGGTVYVNPGTYHVGYDETSVRDAAWMATSSASVTNDVPGLQGVATRIDVPYPPPAVGLIARTSLRAPLDLTEAVSLGVWINASMDFTPPNVSPRTSPLKFVLSREANCSTSDYASEWQHPERVTAGWKYYKIPSFPALTSLPSGLNGIQCIGIELWDSPTATPSVPYAVTIDDIHVQGGDVEIRGDTILRGAGVGQSKVVLAEHANMPLLTIVGSNVEITDLELDGNFDHQDSIDMCPGLLAPAGANDLRIHHNYVHHTKGGGIKVRGERIMIYENVVEWTENPGVELSFFPSFVEVFNNTLRYAFNDDNVWINTAHDIRLRHNRLVGISVPLLASGDPGVPIALRNTLPASIGGIRIQGTAYNITVEENEIVDSPYIGVTVAGGAYDVTLIHNRIERSAQRGIVVKPWGGDVHDIHLIGNLVCDSGAMVGMDIEGEHHEIRDNWTRDNVGGGMRLAGTGSFGDGNYCEDGIAGDFDVANDVRTADAPPTMPAFASGVTW